MEKDFHNMHYFCVGIRKYKYILYLLFSKNPAMFLICCGMLEIESIYLDKIKIVHVINILRENVTLL